MIHCSIHYQKKNAYHLLMKYELVLSLKSVSHLMTLLLHLWSHCLFIKLQAMCDLDVTSSYCHHLPGSVESEYYYSPAIHTMFLPPYLEKSSLFPFILIIFNDSNQRVFFFKFFHTNYLSVPVELQKNWSSSTHSMTLLLRLQSDCMLEKHLTSSSYYCSPSPLLLQQTHRHTIQVQLSQ